MGVKIVAVKVPESWQDFVFPPGSISLDKVPDGGICTLRCSCQVRRMTLSPRNPMMIVCWIRGRCDGFRQSACAMRDLRFKELPGEVSVILDRYTPVQFDPLLSELDDAFGA